MIIIYNAIIKGGSIVLGDGDEDLFIGSNISDAIIRSHNPPKYVNCLLLNPQMGELSTGNDKGARFYNCILENVNIPTKSIFENCTNP